MATVYSLLCFGGKDGLTVTTSIASPCVVTLTNHGLKDGTGVVFSTTGALPTGITAGTTYYSRSTASNTFNIYDTSAHAIAGGTTGQVNTSGTQSGTHTIKSDYWVNTLDSTAKARYGTAGSERAFATMNAWRADRTTNANAVDTEILEIGMAFTDLTTVASIVIPCREVIIQTKVNGTRSGAFHNGISGSGYIVSYASTQQALSMNMYYITVDGIEVQITGNGAYAFGPGSLCCYYTIKNCIARGFSPATTQRGFYINGPGTVENCIAINLSGEGFYLNSGIGVTCNNCLAYGCGSGFKGNSSSQGLYYNNIAVSNTKNWDFWPAYTSARYTNNAGESADNISFTATASSTNLTFASAHGRSVNQPIRFTTTGSLPTVSGVALSTSTTYYVKAVVSTTVITISTTVGGTALTFDGTGSGTHYSTGIWSSDGSEVYIDMSTPTNVFTDPTNFDFTSAGTSGTPNAAALQVDAGTEVFGVEAVDMLGAVRPNYNLGTTEYWDIGPFEFDHLHGAAPATVTIILNTVVTGSQVGIYKQSDGTEILNTTAASTTVSTTYTYTGDTPVYVRVRKAGKQEWTSSPTITSSGLTLYVGQSDDTTY